MASEDLQKTFLQKALEAEKSAANFQDEIIRDSLLRVAESYRLLAKLNGWLSSASNLTLGP